MMELNAKIKSEKTNERASERVEAWKLGWYGHRQAKWQKQRIQIEKITSTEHEKAYTLSEQGRYSNKTLTIAPDNLLLTSVYSVYKCISKWQNGSTSTKSHEKVFRVVSSCFTFSLVWVCKEINSVLESKKNSHIKKRK